MPDFLNDAENAIGNKMNSNAQPGDQVEARADSGANNGMYSYEHFFITLSRVEWETMDKEGTSSNRILLELNQAASDVGVPQQDDKMMDTAVDDKVNSDIPFGNN